MSNLQAPCNRRDNYKLILLGDTGVGKTSIIANYIDNAFYHRQQPTIGIDFLSKHVSYKGNRTRLQLWDSAGQQKYMSLIPNYLRDVHCILFVFDSNNMASLHGLQKWISLYVNSCNQRCVTIICGNKNDLQKRIDKQKLKQLMQRYKMPYHSLSAKTGENIHSLFNLVLDMLHAFYKNLAKNINKQLHDVQTMASERGMIIQKSKQPDRKQICRC